MIITAANIVTEIDRLNKNVYYNYIDHSNRNVIKIVRIERPEGPVYIKRGKFMPGENVNTAREIPISANMIWRVANAVQEDVPLNIDRIVGASYNTRSVKDRFPPFPTRYVIVAPDEDRKKVLQECSKEQFRDWTCLITRLVIKQVSQKTLISQRNPCFLPFLSGCCSETEVSEQLYLNPLYFPYSSVEELYSLCQRRRLRGLTEVFLDCFMEKTA